MRQVRLSISRRRYLSSLVAGGSALPVAACRLLARAPEPSETSPAGGAKPGGGITWSFWSANPQAVESMLGQLKEFRAQNPTVQVEAFWTEWGVYRDKITAMITSGNPPEAMNVDAYWMPAFVEQRLIQRLDPYMKGDKAFKLDAFLPGAFLERHHVFNGVYYAVPEAPESPRVLFYNKRRFAESGVPIPNTLDEQGKWTWDSYLDTASRLSKGTSPERLFGTYDYVTSAGHYSWILSNGGKTLADDYKMCVIDMPETVAALQFQADLLHKHRVAPPPGQNLGAGNVFVTGRVAMQLNGAWAAAPFVALPDFDYGVVAIPKSPKGLRRTMYKPNAIIIPVGIKGQPAATAWELIKFVAGPIYEKALIDAGVNLTNRKDLVEYFLQRSPIKNAKVFMDAFEKKEVAAIPLIPKWDQFNTIVNEELSKVRRGEVSVQVAVSAIKPRVNELLRT